MKIYQMLLGSLLLFFSASCSKPREQVMAPWGEEVEMAGEAVGPDEQEAFDLDEIEHSGELIALTISGPETYYDYHGQPFGLHAMLCQQLADTLGVRLRIEVCRDTAELRRRLSQGDGDMIAYPLQQADSTSPGWLVAADKPMLATRLAEWYSPERLEQARDAEKLMLKTPFVRRKVFAPMLNRQGGIISRYDALFQKYGQTIHWDWRLLAAQCYQESTFDPNARSWAGAQGLMQIMPQTADHLGVERSRLTHPESNIAAAVRYLDELERGFSDIGDRRERQYFVLAAYNGGAHHIRDAMALARRDGLSGRRWAEVSDYVLKLSSPQYYQDTLVRNGYMRGSETVSYVRLIRERYQQYRGVRASSPATSSPQRSRNDRHRKKYSI